MLTAKIRWDDTHVIIVEIDPDDNEIVNVVQVDDSTGDVVIYDVTVHTDNPLE